MRIIRAILVATCVVLLPTAPPVQAASCKGASHEMSLSAGTASPGTGTTTTPIRFSVRYSDNSGCVPSSITVSVSGVGTFALAAGAANGGGIMYSKTLVLPAGRHTYAFAATSGEGGGLINARLTSVSPAAVTITAPTPAPTPRPPTPPPATPLPATPPPPPPPPSTPQPTPTPSPSPTETPAASEEPGPSETAGSGTPTPASSETNQPSPSPTATEDPQIVPPIASPSTPRHPTGPHGAAPHDIWLPIPDGFVPWLTTTSAGVALFLLLVRRRPADEAAMTGAVVGAAGSLDAPAVGSTSLPPMRELVPAVDPDLLRAADDERETRPEEAGVPRWLRPSVREARFRGSRDR